MVSAFDFSLYTGACDVSYLITVAAPPEMVSTLNVLMADKDGLGDTIVGALGGSESSTGVALKVTLVD